jgi:hypothetical protein
VEFRAKPVDPAAFEVALEHVGLRRGAHRLNVVDIPRHYGQQSKVLVSVAPDGMNKLDFQLRSRP